MFKDLSWLQQVQCVINEQAARSNFTHTHRHRQARSLTYIYTYIYTQTQNAWKLNIK